MEINGRCAIAGGNSSLFPIPKHYMPPIYIGFFIHFCQNKYLGNFKNDYYRLSDHLIDVQNIKEIL